MKIVLKLGIAAGMLALALGAQIHPSSCGTTTNKQDCQQCCVDAKQAAFDVCQDAGSGQACLDAAQDAFNGCINACKALPNE